jgi:hypothetical protein
MTQCNEILFNNDGKIIEQCQWGYGHEGEHVYFINPSDHNRDVK